MDLIKLNGLVYKLEYLLPIPGKSTIQKSMGGKGKSMALREANKQKKIRQILTGAQKVFREHGFAGASVDCIAKTAGVSKPTIYSHFADKKELFVEMIRDEFSRQSHVIWNVESTSLDPQKQLEKLGTEFLNAVLNPKLQSLFRLVLAELDRFPEIGSVFYNVTIARGISTLSGLLETYEEQGILDVPDIDLASHQFLELCRAGVFFPNILRVRKTLTGDERSAHVQQAVRTFLHIYEKQRVEN